MPGVSRVWFRVPFAQSSPRSAACEFSPLLAVTWLRSVVSAGPSALFCVTMSNAWRLSGAAGGAAIDLDPESEEAGEGNGDRAKWIGQNGSWHGGGGL